MLTIYNTIIEPQDVQNLGLTLSKKGIRLLLRMRINRNTKGQLHKITPQRRLLLSVMEHARTHLDAKELYRRASEGNSNISLATVYRNLRLFKEQGLIEEKHLGHMHCYYEIKRGGEHQHLVCRACGQVIEFENPLIRQLIAEVQRNNDFSVTEVELYLAGYCSKCKEDN